MINAVLARFPRFHIAFIIKRLLYMEFRGIMERKEKGSWKCRRPKRATTYFRFSVAIENSVSCRDIECSVVTGVGRAGYLGSRLELLGRDKVFWLCVST